MCGAKSRDSVHKPTICEEKGEPKLRVEAGSFRFRTSRAPLPLGQAGSQTQDGDAGTDPLAMHAHIHFDPFFLKEALSRFLSLWRYWYSKNVRKTQLNSVFESRLGLKRYRSCGELQQDGQVDDTAIVSLTSLPVARLGPSDLRPLFLCGEG